MSSRTLVDVMNKQFTAAAKDEDVAEGDLYGTTVDGVPVLLVRLNGIVHAMGRICTHQDADLSEGSIEEGCVVCPLHGSKFDLVTGAAHAAGVRTGAGLRSLRRGRKDLRRSPRRSALMR